MELKLMTTIKEVVNAFYSKRELKGNTIKSVVCADKGKTYLIGYGHAVYGEIDNASGEVTYHSGWDGYSHTTSRHITISKMRSVADVVTDERPEFVGC